MKQTTIQIVVKHSGDTDLTDEASAFQATLTADGAEVLSVSLEHVDLGED